MASVVYLIHFDRPIGNPDNRRAMARHYLGTARRLHARLDEHASGQGAAIMRYVMASGIDWELVRTWKGGRTLERALKNRKRSAALCPYCSSRVGSTSGRQT